MRANIFTKGDVQSGAIVFIHGNSLSAESFRKQFDLIDEIPLVAIDLPGHGLSPKANNPAEVYSLPGYVTAVKEIIADLKLNDFLLVGHSLGGHIAIEAAEELKGLKGLFIFGTPPLGIPPDMANAFLPNPVMSLLFQKDLNDDEIMSVCSAYIHNTPAKSALIKTLSDQLKNTDGEARIQLLQSIGAGKQKNEIEIVKSLKIPIAIIHGEKDAVVNPQYIKSLSIPTLWQNKLHVISDSGHSPQLEQTEKFNALLSDFYNYLFN